MAEDFPQRVEARDLADMFGRAVAVAAGDLVGLDYRDADAADIADVQRRLAEIVADVQVGASALDKWEQGWAEVRARVTREGVTEATLAPQYFRHSLMRFRGRYIRTRSASFEPRLYHALKSELFHTYLADAGRIVEFGCGTGQNLLQLHRMFPKAQLVGADWARPSQELMGLIAAATGAPLSGVRFDMRTLDGSEAIAVDPRTAVITLHAMEQLGGDFERFLNHLIAARPLVGLHLEPVVELYDPNLPFDAAAIAYHRKRRYLEGFLPSLRARSDVETVEVRRLGFGSTFHEAYSLVVWRPRP